MMAQPVAFHCIWSSHMHTKIEGCNSQVLKDLFVGWHCGIVGKVVLVNRNSLTYGCDPAGLTELKESFVSPTGKDLNGWYCPGMIWEENSQSGKNVTAIFT